MNEFLLACELHDVERLRTLLDAGFDARAPLGGKRPLEWLLEMYTRSDRFSACVRLLVDRGAQTGHPALGPVLTDDEAALRSALGADPSLVRKRVTLRSAFTPLDGASLLHVAAEYGHAGAARVLIEGGADVNAEAAVDAHGLGGQTPIFHTVNAHANRSLPVLRLLLDAGAQLDVHVPGITWGRGFEWETTLFDVTPLSYAQAGLLPQMHRDEQDVYRVVRVLLGAAGRAVPPLPNVPNRYLAGRRAQH
jgi:hypothetical protein